MPVTSYEAIRPQLKTGHVVLWQGNGLISRLIRVRSKFSHASLIVTLEEYAGLRDRVWLVEALGTGLELRILSERLKSYDGKAFILQPNANPADRFDLRNFALTECGKGVPYDFKSLLANIFGRVSTEAGRYFCSEFVWDAYCKCCLRCKPGKAPTPGDLPMLLGGTLTEVCA